MTTTSWEALDASAGILTREYSFAPNAFARMITTRLADGSLVAFSPASRMTDEAFDELAKHGEVSALVATNGFHHLGLPEWKRRFPKARIFAPEAAIARLRKKEATIGGSIEPLASLRPLLPASVKVDEVPGMRVGETWVRAASAKGPVWYVSDTFFNMPALPKPLVPRLLFSWTKTAPGFRFNRFGHVLFAKDRPACERFILDRLEEEAPRIVVSAHGAVHETPNAREEMRALLRGEA